MPVPAAEHTHALILRAVDVGESDRIVHLLVPDHGRVTHPLIHRHRSHVAPVDQVVERRIDVRVGVAADRQHRALQRMAGGVRGHELGRDLPAKVRPDREAQVDEAHDRHRAATSTETGKP